MQPHPQFPWIHWGMHPQGGWILKDSRDGFTVHAPTEAGVHQFLADRSNPNQGRMGLGDVVHSATAALGMERCTPCAQRQAALNRAVPNVWPFR